MQHLDNNYTNKGPLSLSSFSFENTSSPNRNVDDGLSLMTSALLNMMETPTSRQKDNSGNGRREYLVSSDVQASSTIATTPPTSNLVHLHEQYRRVNSGDNSYGVNEISRPLWS